MKHLMIYKLAFNVWLEKQHPSHSEYDFDSRGDYENWKCQLYEAYCAGIEFEMTAAKAGM